MGVRFLIQRGRDKKDGKAEVADAGGDVTEDEDLGRLVMLPAWIADQGTTTGEGVTGMTQGWREEVMGKAGCRHRNNV